MSRRSLWLALSLAALAAIAAPSALDAQVMRMQMAEGTDVLRLHAGHILILRQSAEGVMVETIMREGGAAVALDLRKGDRLRAIDGVAIGSLAEATQAYRKVATGQVVSLAVQRGTEARSVRFPKPAPAAEGERTMAVQGAGGAGVGAWTTAGGNSATRLDIAGAQIEENGEGMPQVVNRTSHPAASAVALRVGDVVTAIGGRSIPALAGLVMRYGEVPVGGEVVLTVQRGSETVEVRFPKPADK